MKYIDAISQVDNLLPNAFSQEQKMQWLQNIEDKIYKEVVLTHKTEVLEPNFEEEGFENNELIAKSPYDNLYISYVIAMIFRHLNETVRYNNYMVIFNQEYQEFLNYYNRNNMPK